MSSDTNPATINDLLAIRSHALSEIYQHISRIVICQQTLRTELGPPLSEHLDVANFSRESLMLYTDSPAWASRLRFNIQNILNIVRQHCGLIDLKSVRIKVVIRNQDNKPAQRLSFVSQNTVKLIETATRSIRDHKLRTSLSNIAKHYVGR